ncbi:MAG: hypothetical protein CMG66_04270, partial [Candidatus Marinimicrobia bacterium]|nr:hypothetical protein [Candidatus Neomarinimicrobiota bacterium]
DGDNLIFNLDLDATNGSVTLDGSLATYTPNANYNGDDSFSFSVSDGSESSSASVSLSISAVNDAPVVELNFLPEGSNQSVVFFNEDDLNIYEYDTASLAIGVLGTDIDGDNIDFSSFSIQGGNNIQTSFYGSGAHIDLYLSSPSNYNGTETFTITVTDGELIGSHTFDVTVLPVNDTPVATTGLSSVTAEDQSVIISLSGSDVDGDVLTFNLGSDATYGSVIIDGSIATYTPNTNYSGADSFSFTVTDGSLSDTAEVSLSISAVNDAPIFITSLLEPVDEDISYSFFIEVEDVDNTANELDLSIVSGPSWLDISDFTLFGLPTNDDVGSSTVILNLTDGQLSVSNSFTITVLPVNDPPVATVGLSAVTNEDQSILIALSATDIDGDELFFEIYSQPDNGIAVINGSIATYTPSVNFNGDDSFVFSVSDGFLVDTAIVTLTVDPVNDAPVFVDSNGIPYADDDIVIPDQEIDEDNQFSYEILASDFDGDAVEYSAVALDNNITVWFIDNILNILPAVDWFGTVSIIVTISDDNQAIRSTTFDLVVNSVNDPPIAINQIVEFDEDTESLIILTAQDPDSYNLTYTITSEPSIGTASLNASFLTYIPNQNATGVDSLSYIVNDGELSSNEAYIIYDIAPINDPPELPEFDNLTLNEDEPYIFSLPIYDVDGDVLEYLVDIDGDATSSIEEGILIITPSLNAFGQVEVSITVTDNTDINNNGPLTDFDSFTLNFLPVNDAPLIISTPFYDLFVDEVFEYVVEVEDPDDDQFIFMLINESPYIIPDGMVINNNIITWTPNSTQLYGPIAISVTDMDQDNPLTTIQEFSIDVRLSQSFSLHDGNNLVSYLGVLQDNTIENMLAPISGNITQILTENAASIQLDDGDWIGSLDYIEPTRGYWLRVESGGEIVNYDLATYQTSSEQVFSLHAGWNLISYIGSENIDLDEALPDEIELFFREIISENISAIRDENENWVGSLANIGWQHLKGYWVYVTEPVEFNFSSDSNISRFVNNEIPNYNIYNQPLAFKYKQSQKQSFYYFRDAIIDDEYITDNDWIIAYHEESIIGARKWGGAYTDVPTMGFDGFDETIGYCEDNSKVYFKVFQHSTGKLIPMHGEIPLWKNQNNFIVDILSEKYVLPTEYSISMPYPNPFNPLVNFDYSIPDKNNVKIMVYDIRGRIVTELLNEIRSAGNYSAKWIADDYASGIYFIEFSSGDFTAIRKITLLK